MKRTIARYGISFVRFNSLKAGYSSNTKIGSRITTDHQVDELINKKSWDIREYVPTSLDTELLPPKETVIKLLKISGLPAKNIEQTRVRLANQLSFINILHGLPVDESINPNHARIMDRKPKALDYKSLLQRIEKQEKSEELGEISGSWDSTQQAKLTKDRFFILREGLLRNRE